jgi:hypothetical protein
MVSCPNRDGQRLLESKKSDSACKSNILNENVYTKIHRTEK